MQWRFNPPAAQPGTRYALRKQNQIIVYLFEENGFSIVFMGPNSGLSGCYTLGRARAHYWAGGILSQTLLLHITGQFSLIFSVVDRYSTYCSEETNCVCVFSIQREYENIPPCAEQARPACGQIPTTRRGAAGGGAACAGAGRRGLL